MKRTRNQTRNKAAGMTLIELLVVATIIMAVTAISVPVLKPMLKSQATSNAASTVSTYLNKARTRAMLTGRPCGVLFEVWNGTEECFVKTTIDGTVNSVATASTCLVMRQVEVPPVYSGLTDDARAAYGYQNAATSNDPKLLSNDLYFDRFVKDGGSVSIQFDGIGPWHNYFYDGKDNFPSISPPLRNLSDPTSYVPFKVMRSPRATMTAPVALPQGTVVDLEYSGVDDARIQVLNTAAYNELDARTVSGYQTNTNRYMQMGLTIMFLPNGEVDRLYGVFQDRGANAGNVHRCNSEPYLPSGNIYLLVGRWDGISAIRADADYQNRLKDKLANGVVNINDANNFWVVVNPRTGLVTTAEVNPILNPPQANESDLQVLLNLSREYARLTKTNTGEK